MRDAALDYEGARACESCNTVVLFNSYNDTVRHDNFREIRRDAALSCQLRSRYVTVMESVRDCYGVGMWLLRGVGG